MLRKMSKCYDLVVTFVECYDFEHVTFGSFPQVFPQVLCEMLHVWGLTQQLCNMLYWVHNIDF